MHKTSVSQSLFGHATFKCYLVEMAPVARLPSDSDSKLVLIPPTHWSQLRDLYKHDWPRNLLGFYTVDTFQRWREQKPDIGSSLVIYSLDGDWQQDGTYICMYRFQLFANTLNSTLDRLERAMRLVDWSRGYNLAVAYTRLVGALHDQNIPKSDLQYARLYYMPKDKAILLDLTCPPGITLKPLREEHAETVDDAWPNRSLHLVKQLIALSPNVGAFDANGRLVAWCLRLEAGVHSALQVLDTHQRRGLGLLVCKALCKELAEMGMDSSAGVADDNTASRKTFERAGFQVIDNLVRMKPSVPTNWKE